MKFSLLATKTFPPPIPEYLEPRPRLEQRLDAALRSRHRLILVSAPAGAGKSSLVAAWTSRCAAARSWLSLEKADDEPVRFWSYFLAAIQPRHTDEAQGWLEELQTAASLPAGFLPGLVNLLSSRPEPLVIALDDYHAIQNAEIHQGVLYLLEHLPAQVSLAITTRVDPPLPVHRWRARGQLTEIRAADLRFTLAEAANFLNRRMGLDLRPEDVVRLEERTEGWATGLQLAALSMQGRSDAGAFIAQFSGSHHFVLEYLVNEVLARQNERVQRFLISTSLLESFCAPLCDYLLAAEPAGRDQPEDAASTLAFLERANLFLIPLDEERSWFRYHHLFAGFLRQRLERQDGELLCRLHQRAAEWYSDHERVGEGIRHALAAANPDFAAEIVRRHWHPAASAGRTREVADWIGALPPAKVAADPRLSLLYAWMLVSIGKLNSVEPHIQNAARGLAVACAGFDEDERQSLLGQLAALCAIQAARTGDLAVTQRWVEEARRCSTPQSALVSGLAWMAQANLQRELGNFDQAIASYLEALPLIPATGMLSGAWVMALTLGQAYQVQGQLKAAEDLFRSTLSQAAARGQERVPAIGILQVQLAGIEYEKNHLDEARDFFNQGEANSQRSGMVDLQTSVALLGARLDRLDGRTEQAIQRLQDALSIIRRSDSPGLSAEIHAWLAWLQAEMGDFTPATAWAGEIHPRLQDNPGYTHGVELFCLLRVLIAQQMLEKAGGLALRLEELASERHNLGRAIEAGLLLAEILWQQGLIEESVGRLARSLELAEPAGYARLFLDEGSRLLPILAAYQASTRSSARSEYASWMLATLRQEAGAEATSASPSPAEETPPLTLRELDVLRALIQGLSYPEIARLLVVSPGTVKTHVSHIYAKLGVEGRVAAIRRAQDLKLV